MARLHHHQHSLRRGARTNLAASTISDLVLALLLHSCPSALAERLRKKG